MSLAYLFANLDPPDHDVPSIRRLLADEGEARAASTDDELLIRIRAGDTAAFEQLVRAHYADLCAYVESFMHRRDQAEEIVQDLFFNIWKLGDRWTVRETIPSYLYMSARHMTVRMLSRRSRETRWTSRGESDAVQGTAPAAPDALLTQSDLNAAIARAIIALPPRSREAFILTRRAGMTYVDTARVMGVSVKTVETQVRLALQSLRARLAPWLT